MLWKLLFIEIAGIPGFPATCPLVRSRHMRAHPPTPPYASPTILHTTYTSFGAVYSGDGVFGVCLAFAATVRCRWTRCLRKLSARIPTIAIPCYHLVWRNVMLDAYIAKAGAIVQQQQQFWRYGEYHSPNTNPRPPNEPIWEHNEPVAQPAATPNHQRRTGARTTNCLPYLAEETNPSCTWLHLGQPAIHRRTLAQILG